MVTSIDAVKKVFAVKQRDISNTMHIACSSLEMAQVYGRLSGPALRLLGELTPGPLTVVVDQTGLLPEGYVTRNGTVGIRIPDHPATLQVIATLGVPVTATSLNRSGEPSTPDREALESLDWPSSEPVIVVEDLRPPAFSLPSTLVRVTGSGIEILRQGPISAETVGLVAGG
jgi:L-threonylcarbamoyladenylate synthase